MPILVTAAIVIVLGKVFWSTVLIIGDVTGIKLNAILVIFCL